MKNDFSVLIFYFFVVILSIFVLLLEINGLLIVSIYLTFFIFFHIPGALSQKIKLFFPITTIILSSIFPFLFPDKDIVILGIGISPFGTILFFKYIMRFFIFFVLFQVFSYVFSPRTLLREMSAFGMGDLGLLIGITYNQIYYIQDVAITLWRVISMRNTGRFLYTPKNIFIFLKALVKHSLRRADNVGFGIYATSAFDTSYNTSGILLRKKDIMLVVHLGIIIVLTGVLHFY